MAKFLAKYFGKILLIIRNTQIILEGLSLGLRCHFSLSYSFNFSKEGEHEIVKNVLHLAQRYLNLNLTLKFSYSVSQGKLPQLSHVENDECHFEK